jgi:hypothetical protein
MKVSRDVVFDEMSTWYADVKDSIGADAHEHVVAKNAGQQSQTLNGPRESHFSGSTNRPWSGRLCHNNSPTNIGDASYKGKEKVGEPLGMLDIFVGYSHVDGKSNGFEQNLDEIPAIKTPGVRRANVTRPQVPWVTQKRSKELDLRNWLKTWCYSQLLALKRGRGVMLEAAGLD